MRNTAKSLALLISFAVVSGGTVLAQNQSETAAHPSTAARQNFPFAFASPAQLYDDTLFVRVNSVSISDSTYIRGFFAAFPHPVLSFITVVDHLGQPITGLADTSSWIGIDGIANNGRRIGDIWQQVLEYHEANPSVPGDPDVTHQTPGVMVTEVTARELFQVNTVVTMDHSGSMREEIETAKAAARLYIENMRNGDQAAVIKFASDVRIVQPFTRDRRALTQAVNRQPAGGKTLLYDALIASIRLIKEESGRRAIIAYTDGFDNQSVSSKDAVIDSAITYGIPIFTIGIGDSVSQSVLQEIAITTGGIYLHAPTADDLKDIFLQLSTVINNYYVMAHTSTDPERNNTWRIVDVTLNHQRWQQRAVGRYFVPAKNLKYDVAVSQASRTDSVGQINGLSRNFSRAGETYSYEIRLTNIGRETVRDIYLTEVFADSVRVGGFSIEPLSANADSAVWRFPALDGGSSLNITFNATVPPAMPAGITPLVNVARFVAERDTVTANNFSVDTVYAVGAISPPPQNNIDVAISQVSTTDSFSVVAGDTLKLVKPGETISYRLRIANLGDSTASNIRVTNVFADSVAASDFSIAPASTNGDSATWQFAELELDSSIVINFIATARPVMPEQRIALINIARVLADGDTLLVNNFSADTVFTTGAAPPPPERIDAAISLTAITDSIRVSNGDTLKYVTSGETYTYKIHLTNLGTVTARDIRVTNVFPDSITAHGFSITPSILLTDSAKWQFAELSAGGTIDIDFLATVYPAMPLGETRLVNIARVEAAQDTFLANNFSIENTVIAIHAELPPRRFVDVSIAQLSITDSVSVVAGDTTKFVRTGQTFAYRLWVRNLGDTTASNIRLKNIFADSTVAGEFSVAPVIVNADSALWLFSTLAAGEVVVIDFKAMVAPVIPVQRMALINAAYVTADGDMFAANNISVDTVFAIDKTLPPPKTIDVSIQQISLTDSAVVASGDTTKFVDAGETYAYQIWIINVGDTTANNIRVTNVFPDSIVASGFSVPPLTVNADSAQWHFNELGAGQTLRLAFNAVVKPHMPSTLTALVNVAHVAVDGDVDLSNNAASDTVYAVAKASRPPALPEIVVFPNVAQVGDSIEVAVRTHAPLAEWDVLVYFADGTVHENYADDFIRESSLQPQVWYRLNPVFKETSLRTAAYSENVIFELRTHDVFGNRAAVRATVVVQSANDLVLDRNVFEPANGEPLGINFRLSSNRVALLELLDIAGRRVARLAERAFDAGWNLLNWDGRTEGGDLVGSGVYLVTIKSNEFKSWRKVVVVR